VLALSLVCLALVALLAYREWGARRERGEAATLLARSRAETAAVRAEAAEERAEWVKERRELNQRIQAPEKAVQAVAEEAARERPPYKRRVPIGADDDARFAERDGRG
jgi:hypothetical protein